MFLLSICWLLDANSEHNNSAISVINSIYIISSCPFFRNHLKPHSKWGERGRGGIVCGWPSRRHFESWILIDILNFANVRYSGERNKTCFSQYTKSSWYIRGFLLKSSTFKCLIMFNVTCITILFTSWKVY